ncbi:PREDICTED: uncharacterized protein LOC109167850 [Ipomoea nil]|uniref:uncharacterized protein LOC109167850 n=1 Tax=Ipomoea nil TaxID=35883 RepID=UPI00090097A1|nr:PREDICTED: uncharacterized protein LOC109167850 [Ipomoea nil]
MVSRKQPDFVFLMETKVGRDHAERIRVKIGYEGLFYVDSDGLSGGLALLWKKNSTARLLSYSTNYVDVEVTITGFPGWRMTERGNLHPNSLLRGFGEAIEDCGLAQMPMNGYPYTWEKGKGTVNWMEERLDKVLVKNERRSMVTGATVMNLRTRKSDHSALFLGIHESFGRSGPVLAGGRGQGLQNCIQYCGNRLTRWGGDRYHRYGKQINELTREQQRLRGRTDPASLAEFQRLEQLLSCTEAQEDAYWRQRAKQHWLKEADATKFFHRYASHRKKKNTISRLMNDNEDWVEGEPMKNFILQYYNRIFCSGTPGTGEGFFEGIILRVTQAQNESLLRPFDLEEGDVASFIINCIESCDFPPGLTDTGVVLIPKKNTPEFVTDLRPIALSNVVYRIMAKMLSNRMKPLMEEIISESQSAFIPDRLIMDNILLAAEVGHFLNRKQCRMGGWSALKLDMANAYDRTEWSFLRKMMLALGFHGGWVELIMKCVTSVSYNVLEANEIKRCLSVYEDLSGQAVNYHKSSICYSRNTSNVDRENVAQVLGVTQAPNFGKYLGLPSFVGRHKKAAFAYIEDKIRQRIGSWNKRLLSQAGKEILLKTVAQSMPTFSMSVFLLPISVCTAIERTMNRYWWDSGTDRRIHWKACDKLCIPKKYGGLGFKDLRAFNLAMLGKQAWRRLTKPESLVTRVYKARYFPKGSFFDAQVGNNPSFYWRSIMAAKSIVCSGVRRRIGNGESTLIWTHPWLQDDQDPMIQTEMPTQLQEARVAGLIDQQTGTWDPSILTDLFQPTDVVNIMRIPVSPDYDDTWYWHGDPRGVYSVKSGYRLIVGNYQGDNGTFAKWLALWKLKIPQNGEYSDGMLYATSILYNIWRARNGAVWEATLPRPVTVLNTAAAAKLAWTRAHPAPAARATPLPTESPLIPRGGRAARYRTAHCRTITWAAKEDLSSRCGFYARNRPSRGWGSFTRHEWGIRFGLWRTTPELLLATYG